MAARLGGAVFANGSWRDLVPLCHRIYEARLGPRDFLADIGEAEFSALLDLILGKLSAYSARGAKVLMHGGEILYGLPRAGLVVLWLRTGLEKYPDGNSSESDQR